MNLIKLDAIDSTNSFLRRLIVDNEVKDFTVAVADLQTEARGQMGTKWHSESGKNLTFSVLKKVSCLGNDDQFYLSMAVSLAVYKALEYFTVPQLKIKWPNDILSANRKICGILIENVIKNGEMYAAIIGIGLNVNQTEFEGVLNASSLRQITGVVYDKDEILHKIVEQIKHYELLVIENRWEELKEEYEQQLFRKDKPSTFKDKNENLFMGFIKGVSNKGMLQVLLEDEVLKEFDLKEIRLLY